MINHIAEAMSVASLCDRLKTNDAFMGLAAAYHGIKAQDISKNGKYYNRLIRLIREKKASIENHDEEVICMTGELLYGKDGMNVPGLLIDDESGITAPEFEGMSDDPLDD